MKKIVLNISDFVYEKLRFEAIKERKNIADLITERLFVKPFDKDVQEAYDAYMDKEVQKILGG